MEVAQTYESTSDDEESILTDGQAGKEFAYKLRLLSLHLNASSSEEVEKALAAGLKIEKTFDLSEVLRVNGARESLSEQGKALVGFFEEDVELNQGLEWVKSNSSWLSGLGESSLREYDLWSGFSENFISSFRIAMTYKRRTIHSLMYAYSPLFNAIRIFFSDIDLDSSLVEKKLRLLALTSLCAKSTSKEVSYESIAKALGVEVDEIDAWVIDGMLCEKRSTFPDVCTGKRICLCADATCLTFVLIQPFNSISSPVDFRNLPKPSEFFPSIPVRLVKPNGIY